MFLYYTRGLVRCVGGVHCGDTGAMKAEGQAVHKRVIACWQWDMWSQEWWVYASTQPAVD